MNIQAMMKQAQQMQKDMLKAKQEIDEMVFETTKSFISLKMNGNKQIVEFNISQNNLEKEDIEILEDLILVAVNETIKKIENETESKMGKYTKGMPGLF